jgi:hypothetical protein
MVLLDFQRAVITTGSLTILYAGRDPALDGSSVVAVIARLPDSCSANGCDNVPMLRCAPIRVYCIQRVPAVQKIQSYAPVEPDGIPDRYQSLVTQLLTNSSTVSSRTVTGPGRWRTLCVNDQQRNLLYYSN